MLMAGKSVEKRQQDSSYSLFSVAWPGELWVLVIRLPYPNGIAAISPGLRGTSYPGNRNKNRNPARVASALLNPWPTTLSGLKQTRHGLSFNVIIAVALKTAETYLEGKFC
jgi:hypothetical protein